MQIAILPGETYDYEYRLPADHLGGTHWYHPHHHGSTGGHVDGGASGMIIVEDDTSDNLPTVYSSMPEHVILLTAISTDVADIEAAGGGSWMTTAPAVPLLLVNGVLSPTITVASGSGTTWMRMRFAFSSSAHSLAIALPSACQAVLMAKDGVYLRRGSRETSVLKFAPGNRADIAITCTVGTHVFTSSPDDASGAGDNGELGGSMSPFAAGTVLTVEWQESGGGSATAPALPALTLDYPYYLKDLIDEEPDETFALGVSIVGGGGTTGCTFECGAYEHDTVFQYMSVNKVQEFSVNAGAHPFHMHINHMQLTQVGDDGWGGWHQEGDFIDTFLGTGSVRFLTDTFTGEVVMHCHLLVHEDLGCMTHMMIVDDRTTQPWGYCIHADPLPSAAAISLSVSSALLAVLLALLYNGKLPGTGAGSTKSDTVLGLSRETFVTYACGVSFSLLFILAVLPVVYDDGYAGGLVATLHANEASYLAFLPLHLVCLLLVMACGGWVAAVKYQCLPDRSVCGNSGKDHKVGHEAVMTDVEMAPAGDAEAFAVVAKVDTDN